MLLILSGCNKRPSDSISKESTGTAVTITKPKTDSSTVVQMNYEKSMIHREYDNDSLLLDIPDLRRLVKSFTSKPMVKEKEYGAGDYFGKYRVYADKLDTLVI